MPFPPLPMQTSRHSLLRFPCSSCRGESLQVVPRGFAIFDISNGPREVIRLSGSTFGRSWGLGHLLNTNNPGWTTDGSEFLR